MNSNVSCMKLWLVREAEDCIGLEPSHFWRQIYSFTQWSCLPAHTAERILKWICGVIWPILRCSYPASQCAQIFKYLEFKNWNHYSGYLFCTAYTWSQWENKKRKAMASNVRMQGAPVPWCSHVQGDWKNSQKQVFNSHACRSRWSYMELKEQKKREYISSCIQYNLKS